MNVRKARLVRILARFFNRVDDMIDKSLEAEAVDRGFDHGEFSGLAHALDREKRADEIARRLGFETADLASEIAHAIGFGFAFEDARAYHIAANRGAFFGYDEMPDGTFRPRGERS